MNRKKEAGIDMSKDKREELTFNDSANKPIPESPLQLSQSVAKAKLFSVKNKLKLNISKE